MQYLTIPLQTNINMKKCIALLFLISISTTVSAQKSEVIVIGNVHRPMPAYNADTLYKMLERIKPDIILHELDSSFFTPDFNFKDSSKENEQNASEKYKKAHSATLIRPFEFEGRNDYRRKKGIKQAEEPSMDLLDSLYITKKLTLKQATVVSEYKRLTDLLNSFGYKRGIEFNNKITDSISKLRQHYQHYEIRQVINQRKEFAQRFVTTTTNEKVSYTEGYNRFCDFWDLRNQTMAKNIEAVVRAHPGKRVVVLTGYFHRYYLLELLSKAKGKANFTIKEFYDFK